MKRTIYIIGLALLLGWHLPAEACGKNNCKPRDYQAFALGEMVVSAGAGSGNEGATVSSFTAEQIEKTHSLSVPEALSYMPGVSVTTGYKNEPRIRIHGFQQYEALILIDGVPYYETNYGSLNLNQLPTDMIARIDVVKGAASVLYGAGAMGGVINIITKNAGDKASFSASAQAGNDGRYKLGASHGNSLGKFKYWLSASRQEADGWRLSDDFSPREGVIISKPGGTRKAVLEDGDLRNNSDLTQTSLWGKAGIELGPQTKYYLSSYFIDSSWGFPISTREVIIFPNRPAFSRFARMDEYRDWGVDLNGEQKISDSFKLRGKLFYHNHQDSYVSFSDISTSNKIAHSTYKDYLAGGSLFADWNILPQDTLRFALHYKGDSHKERDDSYLPFAESFSYTGSLALENEWTPVEGLSIIAGVSYDWFEVDKAQAIQTDKNGDYTATDNLPTGDAKDSFNPMLAASYTFSGQTRLYASVARKTRFPTLQQLFASKGGNLALEPQKSTNYTLGVTRPIADLGWGEASVFYYDIEDRINRDAPYPDAMFRNYAEVKIYGFELAGHINITQDLECRLGYTFLQAKDESPGRITDDVRGVPEHKIDLGLSYTVPKAKTRLHLEGLFMAEQWDQLPTPASPNTEALKCSGYFLANFRVAQPIGEHLEAFAFVSNITDVDYESQTGFPGPGRNFWIGVKTSF
jgi:iron complex outermembrane receptor protein